MQTISGDIKIDHPHIIIFPQNMKACTCPYNILYHKLLQILIIYYTSIKTMDIFFF